MKKEKENTNYRKRFVNGFNRIVNATHKNPYKVWDDLIHLFAIEIQNTCTRFYKENDNLKKIWDEREERYISIVNSYPKEVIKLFPQMFALLVLEYEKEQKENKQEDVLGSIYMELGISSKNHGQFFTPYSICELMADVTIEKKNVKKAVKEHGYITINDCACGAGATVIAGIHKAKSYFKNLNWQNHILAITQDVDELCSLMCYIQLSLLPVAGIVSVGNTLTEPVITDEKRIWRTPLYYSEVWQMRNFIKGLKSL